jgi:heme A synthase
MRHTGAGLAIPDFPLAFGRVLPPFADSGVVIHFAHRTFALLVAAAVLNLSWRGWRSGDPRFVRPATLCLALTLVQITLGAATVLTRKAVVPTTAHVATGAALLGISFFLALRASRLTKAWEEARGAAPLRDATAA